MRTHILFAAAALAALPVATLPSVALGQSDAITNINGIDPPAVAGTVYFNKANCDDAANTIYDLTLNPGEGVSNGYLWAGIQNGGCELETNRNAQTADRCQPIAGNPQTIGDNATFSNLTLDALVATGIVDCQNTALEGTPYEIYTFRNEDPGGNDVAAEGFGVAPFTVDVTPPDELNITSSLFQEGSQFSIGWSIPTDSVSIAEYRLYAADTDDPQAALAGGTVATTQQSGARSISVSAASLGLAPGDEVFLFATAVDNASFIIGDGNEGPLSVSTRGVAAQTNGFCDDPNVDCSGCSVSPFVLSDGRPSSGLWVIGLVFAIVVGRRLRR